jgi:hypothetical protein
VGDAAADAIAYASRGTSLQASDPFVLRLNARVSFAVTALAFDPLQGVLVVCYLNAGFALWSLQNQLKAPLYVHSCDTLG